VRSRSRTTDAVGKVREGEPSIEPVPGSYVKDIPEFAPWTFQPGESPEGSGRCGSEEFRLAFKCSKALKQIALK